MRMDTFHRLTVHCSSIPRLARIAPLVLLLAAAAPAAEGQGGGGASIAAPATAAAPRHAGPRIGLALSGGGAPGLAPVGVLRAPERAGVPLHAISGTSMGSLVGGLYAAGYSATDLQEIARGI